MLHAAKFEPETFSFWLIKLFKHLKGESVNAAR